MSGGEDNEDNAVIKVKGQRTKEELIQKVTGSVEEEIDKIRIAGGSPDTNSFVMRVSQSIGEQIHGDWKVKSSITEKLAPEKVKHQLNKFAESIGKTLEDLNTDELKTFSQSEIPSLMQELIQVDDKFIIPESMLPELPGYKFKVEFQQTLKHRIS